MDDLVKRLRDAVAHPYYDGTCNVSAPDAAAAAAPIEALNLLVKALMPPKPEDEPKNGPCCHAFDGEYWIGNGCTCGNYDDAQDARDWATCMNRWLDAKKLVDAGGGKHG